MIIIELFCVHNATFYSICVALLRKNYVHNDEKYFRFIVTMKKNKNVDSYFENMKNGHF
jgi:hypothetical protein